VMRVCVGTRIATGAASGLLVPVSGWRVDGTVVGIEVEPWLGWVGRITAGEGVEFPASIWRRGVLNAVAGMKEKKPATPTRLKIRQKTPAQSRTIKPVIQAIQPFWDMFLPTKRFRTCWHYKS
jgi:hypothetical protein